MVVIVVHNCVWRGEEVGEGGGEGRRRGEDRKREVGRRRGEEGRERERAQYSTNQVFPHLPPSPSPSPPPPHLLPLTLCLSTDIHMGEGCTDCQEVKVFLVRESAYQQPTFSFLHCSKLLNGCDVALEEGGELSGQLITRLSTHGSLLTLRVLKCLRSSGIRWGS